MPRDYEALNQQIAERRKDKAFMARLKNRIKKDKPILDRLAESSGLVYAATKRCPCGAGLAYDPRGLSGRLIQGYWDCSLILLGTADEKVQHTARLPFTFYEIKSENQPSAQGATTRPSAV